MSDKRAIACNLEKAESSAVRGALAYIVTLAHERARVLVRSRGGRWIEKWVAIKNLGNFRLRTIPKESPIHDRLPDYSGSSLEVLASHGAGQNLKFRGEK
jgi:hypothetical protein